MKPLLAHIFAPQRVTYPCYVQPKLNGIRALYQNGAFQSRDELPFPSGLLEHLAKPLREVFGSEVILDGELYVHGWPLQRINAAVTPVRQTPSIDTECVEYHVFDVANYNKNFDERLREHSEAGDGKQWKFIRTVHCGNKKLADELYAQFVSDGYEGMMYRLGDCPYTVPKQKWSDRLTTFSPNNARTPFLSDKDNRCWHLLKRKDWRDDEYYCVEVEEGEGKLKGTLGALRCYKHKAGTGCQWKDGKLLWTFPETFSVGSGLTDSQRHFYWNNPPIGKLIKVKYLVLSSDGIPLNPTIHPDHIVQ